MYIRSRKKTEQKKKISVIQNTKLTTIVFVVNSKLDYNVGNCPLLHIGKYECILLCLVLKTIANQDEILYLHL